MEHLAHQVRRIRRNLSSDGGQTMAEYAFILAAIAVVAFAAFQLFGVDVRESIIASGDTFS